MLSKTAKFAIDKYIFRHPYSCCIQIIILLGIVHWIFGAESVQLIFVIANYIGVSYVESLGEIRRVGNKKQKQLYKSIHWYQILLPVTTPQLFFYYPRQYWYYERLVGVPSVVLLILEGLILCKYGWHHGILL